ncbi:MAG TPA: ABC transporter permease [Flavisolibacter sp.]|nr:ABC transporter permease [Flavisolibacter sp.]
MFRNYLKVALRNLWKQKTFSAINIIGLATGLCCFLLIAMYVMDELSYDQSHTKGDRIYRVSSDIKFNGSEMHFTQTPDLMAEVLQKDYPEIDATTRLYVNNGNKLVKKGSEFINEGDVGHVDSSFFEVFTIPAINGNTRGALNEPNTVVLTRKAAMKYFGTTDVVGKTIETNDNTSTLYKIMAVVEDVPKNSHFRFDFFFSMDNVQYQWGQHMSNNFHTYLLLKPGVDAAAFEKKALNEYVVRYVLPAAKQFMDIGSMEEFEKAGNYLRYSLMPLKKLHLYSDRSFELTPSGNIQYVYVFSAVALFILLIACVNFMNLTTARSANRAKEVGIRKVLGTERKALIAQFLSESTLMVLLAMLIALALTYLVLPLFNDVANKQMTFSSLLSPVILPLLVLLPFLVGLLAGSYPAFYLSSFRPIAVLKGRFGNKRGTLRSALVVFQFATSIILIIGTIVIYRQLNYIQTKELGYKKEQVLVINDAYALRNNMAAFKNDVLQMPGVEAGTLSAYLPVSNSSRSDNSYSTTPVMNAETGFNMQAWDVDYDYLKTMGMTLVKGRAFSKEFGSDSSAIIINETAAKILGEGDPIGKYVYRTNNGGTPLKYQVIGVVKNFNFESLKQAVGPLAMFLHDGYGLASFKIKTAGIDGLLSSIEKKWKNMAPGMPFSYRFLDESFNDMYRDEQRVGKIALTFSILAILIACLGLFGLAAFVAEQRTKEIGIRKVLGASVNGLVGLLSKDFVKLVAIAFVIAAPVAWYFMNQWLQDFEYRIEVNWVVFAIAALIALFIAVATISFQAIKAALANPVKNLRTE